MSTRPASTKRPATSTTRQKRKSSYENHHVIELMADAFAISEADARSFVKRLMRTIALALHEGRSIQLPGIGTLHVVERGLNGATMTDDLEKGRIVFYPHKLFIRAMVGSDPSSDPSDHPTVMAGTANLEKSLMQTPPPESRLNRHISYRELIAGLCEIWTMMLVEGVTIRLSGIGRMQYRNKAPLWTLRRRVPGQIREVELETAPELAECLPRKRSSSTPAAFERRNIALLTEEHRKLDPMLAPPSTPFTKRAPKRESKAPRERGTPNGRKTAHRRVAQ